MICLFVRNACYSRLHFTDVSEGELTAGESTVLIHVNISNVESGHS